MSLIRVAFEYARRQREYEESDYILGPSDLLLRSFTERGVSEDKLLKTPYGLDLRFQAIEGIELPKGKKFVVLYVGHSLSEGAALRD